MRRIGYLASVTLAAILVAGAVPVSAQTDEDPGDPELPQLEPEMASGTWFGSAIAGGTAEFATGDLELLLDLEVHGNFYFDVLPDGEVTGSWDIVAPSAGTIDMRGGGITGATLDATYTGTGDVSGDRSRVEADAIVTQKGTVRTKSSGNIAANSTDPLPSKIEAVVTTAFCNEVYGEWDFSWEQTLQSVGWNPSFSGEWVAVRQSEAFEEAVEDGGVEELATQMANVLSEWNGEIIPMLKNRDHSQPYSADEWRTIVGFFVEIEELQNTLRNLTPCDKVAIGTDQVEAWLNVLGKGLANVIFSAIDAGSLSGADINLLAAFGIRSGVLGSATFQPGRGDELSEALRVEAEAVLNEHTRVVVDEGKRFMEIEVTPEVAIVRKVGQTMGWTFTLRADGESVEVTADGEKVP